VPLEKFIGNFAPKYKLDLPGLGEKSAEFKPEVSAKKRGFLIEFLINREVGEKLISIGNLVERFRLVSCAEANPASPIGKFIDRRKISTLPVFEQSCYFDSREDKVYIFNLDIKSGRVLGFAIRKIDDSFSGPKYNIKNYAEFKKNGLVPGLTDSFIQEVDSINNYFNILNVDFTKDVTVTEGQIDAMFVRNCVATTGVTKSKNLLGSLLSKKNARVLFDNDKAGKTQTLEFIKEGYRVFLWSKLTFALKKEYPGQIREIRSIKDVNDLFRFMLNHDTDLDFTRFNLFLDKYFSDSAFDLLLV